MQGHITLDPKDAHPNTMSKHSSQIQNPFKNNEQSFASLKQHTKELAKIWPDWQVVVSKLDTLESKLKATESKELAMNISVSLDLFFQYSTGGSKEISDQKTTFKNKLQDVLETINIPPLSGDGFHRAGVFSILALLFYSPFVGLLIYTIKEQAVLEQTSKMMGGSFSLSSIIGLVSFVGVMLALITLAVIASALFEYFEHRSKTIALNELKDTISTLADQMTTLQIHEKTEQAKDCSTDSHLGISSLLDAQEHRQGELQNFVDDAASYVRFFQESSPQAHVARPVALVNSFSTDSIQRRYAEIDLCC